MKIHILIAQKKAELRRCDPRSRDRLRRKLKVLEKVEELGVSPRRRVRVGAYRSGKSENASA